MVRGLLDYGAELLAQDQERPRSINREMRYTRNPWLVKPELTVSLLFGEISGYPTNLTYKFKACGSLLADLILTADSR